MKPRDLIGFVPFVLFSVLAPHLGAGWAAVAGVAAAVVVIAATARGGVKILPVVQAVILLAMVGVGFAGGPAVDDALVRYGPAVAGLIMGAYMVLSAPAAPFTAQLSHDEVPREMWHNRRFLEVNTRVSTAWGFAVVVLGLCSTLSAMLAAEGLPLAAVLAVSWVLPVIAFWRAAVYTKRTVAAAHAAHAAYAARAAQGGSAS